MNTPTWLKRLKLWSVALVDQPANPEAQVVLLKSASPANKLKPDLTIDQTPDPENDPGHQSGHYGDEDDTTKAMVECGICGDNHATGDHDSAIAKQPGLGDVHAPGPMMAKQERSMDTQASIEKAEHLQKQLNEEQAKNAALAERIEKVEAMQRRERYIAKAKLYKYVPGLSPDDFGTILMKIDGVLNQEERDKFDGMLKASDASLRQAAIFQEFGRSGEGRQGEPGVELTKLAKAKMSSEPTLTFAAAYAKALQENPKMYAEYLESQTKGGR